MKIYPNLSRLRETEILKHIWELSIWPRWKKSENCKQNSPRENIQCSFLTFFKHKPFYITPPTDLEIESCLCIQCKNVYLLLRRNITYRGLKNLMKLGSSVIWQKGESQNGGNKNTKHAKFSEKWTFFTSWYAHQICLFAILPMSSVTKFIKNDPKKDIKNFSESDDAIIMFLKQRLSLLRKMVKLHCIHEQLVLIKKTRFSILWKSYCRKVKVISVIDLILTTFRKFFHWYVRHSQENTLS